MASALRLVSVTRNDHIGSWGDGGVRKGTPPYGGLLVLTRAAATIVVAKDARLQ